MTTKPQQRTENTLIFPEERVSHKITFIDSRHS